jgi:hypothetical protein
LLLFLLLPSLLSATEETAKKKQHREEMKNSTEKRCGCYLFSSTTAAISSLCRDHLCAGSSSRRTAQRRDASVFISA